MQLVLSNYESPESKEPIYPFKLGSMPKLDRTGSNKASVSVSVLNWLYRSFTVNFEVLLFEAAIYGKRGQWASKFTKFELLTRRGS